MSSLIGHLETYLGEIEGGWSESSDGAQTALQIVKFKGGEVGGPIPYTTLGLSKYPLASRVSGKKIRMELLLLAPTGFGDQNILALLQTIALEALEGGSAYLRGDVIGPRGPLFGGHSFTAFYVAVPVYFPESFHVCNSVGGEQVVIAWLVPITESEVQFIREHGWGQFEDLLAELNPDLVDWSRVTIS